MSTQTNRTGKPIRLFPAVNDSRGTSWQNAAQCAQGSAAQSAQPHRNWYAVTVRRTPEALSV